MSTLVAYLNATTSPLLQNLQSSLQDRFEQLGRKALRLVRPFRYVNFLRILKIAHHGLFLYGTTWFVITNRFIKGRRSSLFSFFRQQPANWPELTAQITWGLYVFGGGGFPFFCVKHPTRNGWFRDWAHPLFYWGFLSIYKCVWSTWHAVAVASYFTDPRRNPPPKWISPKWNRIWRQCQRERVLQFQNLRYQHQWAGIVQELNNPENQQLVTSVRIDNRWVALGAFGAAVQDVLDDTLDRILLRPHRVVAFFHRLGTSFHHLSEVSIAMTLNLPLQAISALLESAPNLFFLKLDGVALSVHDLQPDLLEFGRSLHGVGSQHPLVLKKLLLEECRLENDEPDPQLRTRYSMDLLLAPAVYTALTPPTRLNLTELRLWVQCQRISVVELAIMLGQNTSLRTLDLHLTKDNSNDNNDDEEDDGPVDWILLPLAQVLEYSNTTLTHLSIQLPMGIPQDTLSHRALVRMAQRNEILQSVCLIRTDAQARIRIPEMDFYLQCNRLGRRDFRLQSAEGTLDVDRWVEILLEQKLNTSVIYYFLSMNPSLLLESVRDSRHSGFRTKSLQKAWKLLQGKAHWATFAYDVKK